MLSEFCITEAIDNLFSETNDNNIFKNIAEFHLKFENIHPFVDGNGRTGRMLINLMLTNANFLPVNIKLNDVGKYYRCFRQYDISKDRGIQEMFNLITKYEYDQLESLIKLINPKYNLG